ncbi:MAG: phosphoenolpyruvate synthase [Alphaproteobacteria bacterium]|nr:phosphoenolpyruvate synthase [Alphaproteobacteria bacterium]
MPDAPPLLLPLSELHEAHRPLVGGKAAQLGALTRVPGAHVPEGFCVSAAAFRLVRPSLQPALSRLTEHVEALGEASAALQARLLEAPLPEALRRALNAALSEPGQAWAVRSSAIGEDGPEASFAGLHDSVLNVLGAEAVGQALRRCWASLFSERALAYRLSQGLDPREAQIAVVVQRMLSPRVSGVLFTADPVSGNRRVCAVEAVPGLGVDLVGGQQRADAFLIREGRVLQRTVAEKSEATWPAAQGGTERRPLPPEARRTPCLSEAELVRLEALGRRVEAALGGPQDIEWCLVDDTLQLVQSRPITGLFPLPEGGPGARVYLSVGHQQMMTEAMKPLGLSVFQASAGRPMFEAGGRLFVDPTAQLAVPAQRAGLLAMMADADPLTADALSTLLAREGFIEAQAAPPRPPLGPPPSPGEPDALIAEWEAALARIREDLSGLRGAPLIARIQEDLQALRDQLKSPTGFATILAGLGAASALRAQLQAQLGDADAVEPLSRAVPGNVTAEMGLSLMALADALRPWPEVLDHLREAGDEDLLEGLRALPGGALAREALGAWFERYGARCVGEIDLTRPRWSERPSAVMPLLLQHVAEQAPGEAARRVEAGQQEAAAAERALLERLRALPEGEAKAAEAQGRVRQLRALAGYREYPKYAMICRFQVYRRALLAEAARLAEAGHVEAAEDIDYLRLEELLALCRGEALDPGLVARRRAAHRRHARLSPPRVITWEGERLHGAYTQTALPPGALPGLAVSTGVVEGRARVLLRLEQARLEPGDILVTRYTDPSWTPAFLSVRGLVTEVGARMGHGAVIAREYGLPAVLGVEGATRRIRDGQQIRVDGTRGWVELL